MKLGIETSRRITELREDLFLSVEDCAKAAQMRPHYLQSIENFELDDVHPITLEKISDVLQTTLEELLEPPDEEASKAPTFRNEFTNFVCGLFLFPLLAFLFLFPLTLGCFLTTLLLEMLS